MVRVSALRLGSALPEWVEIVPGCLAQLSWPFVEKNFFIRHPLWLGSAPPKPVKVNLGCLAASSCSFWRWKKFIRHWGRNVLWVTSWQNLFDIHVACSMSSLDVGRWSACYWAVSRRRSKFPWFLTLGSGLYKTEASRADLPFNQNPPGRRHQLQRSISDMEGEYSK